MTAVRIAELRPEEVALVDRHLPLNRLDGRQTYLVAWDDELPVGHAHLAWSGTHLGLPELQDVFVLPERRRRGVATALTRAAEDAARARGSARLSLSVSRDGNPDARRLYERLGYEDAGVEPVRVEGAIMLRGRPFEVDDTLVYLVKLLADDAQEARRRPLDSGVLGGFDDVHGPNVVVDADRP